MRLFPLSICFALTLFAHEAAAAIITVTTTNNASPAGDGQTSFYEALQMAAGGDTIRFSIAGAGPHVIPTPLGGYPLITASNLTIDGYSQTGALPNTNSILGGNNAQIKIVLDSTGTNSAANPTNPALPLRRSTRLPNGTSTTGYNTNESAVIAVLGADNFRIRGISFLGRVTVGSASDPKVYCIALIQEATNARVQGCWFGLPPGGSTQSQVKGCAAAVAAFAYRSGGEVYSRGLVFGTDGDGTNDVNEFNLTMGMNIALALELPNLKVAGNYFNVFPNGTNFLDLDAYYAFQVAASNGDSDTLQHLLNGRLADNATIGTDGNGVSDANERNIFNHALADHELEFYTSATNIVIAGNYFGVGVDGTTPSPLSLHEQPDFVELPGRSSIRIGSNGDGVSDDLEGNLIVNGPGDNFVLAPETVPIVSRRNRMVNNNYLGIPFADGENGRAYLSYYGLVVPDSSMVVPVISSFANNVISGSMIGPNGADYISAFIDIYVIDPAALAKRHNWPYPITHTSRWLATFTDNGPGDLNLSFNQFALDLSSFGLSDSAYVTVAVTYSKQAAASNTDQAVTGPTSNPMSRRPSMGIEVAPPNRLILSWLAKDGLYAPQQNTFAPNLWRSVSGTLTYVGGRNLFETGIDPFVRVSLYRLISQ